MNTIPGFIASVGNDNVTSATHDFPWFILRARQQRPYNSLHVGAPLYWYDPGKKSIFLMTRLTKVEQLEYRNTEELQMWLSERYGEHCSTDPYFIEKAGKCRYCVAFWLHPIEQLNLPKPPGCDLDRDGWLPCNSEHGRLWLSSLEFSDPDGYYGPHLRSAASQLAAEGYFNLTGLEDVRARRLQEVVQRRGQPEFRASLIDAYGGRCAATECDAVSALEAAHILPYMGPQSNQISNGLLLRADIHTLFDLNLLGIEPDSLKLAIGSSLKGTSYNDINGKPLAVPDDPALQPNTNALRARWKQFLTPTKVS